MPAKPAALCQEGRERSYEKASSLHMSRRRQVSKGSYLETYLAYGSLPRRILSEAPALQTKEESNIWSSCPMAKVCRQSERQSRS